MYHFKSRRLLSLLLLPILLLVTSTASATTYNEDKLVLGKEFVLEAGDSLNGDLAVFGGEVQLKNSSTVNGDIVVFGGKLEINNTVNGSVTQFGGEIELKSRAVVNGDFTSFGAKVDRDKSAVINGDSVRQNSEKIQKIEEIGRQIGNSEIVIEQPVRKGFFASLFAFMTTLLLFMARLLACAGVAVIANLLFEKHLVATSQTILKRPLESIGIGLLTMVALPFVLLFFTITVVLIPLAILLVIIFVVVCLYGWIAAGYEFGRILARALKVQWPSNWTTAAGTFAMSLILFGLSKLIPCVGWIPSAAVLSAGIGAIIIYHGKLFQNGGKKQGDPLLPGNHPTGSIPEEASLQKTSTVTSPAPSVTPETGADKSPAASDVIELGPSTTSETEPEQPDTDPHREGNVLGSHQPKTGTEEKPRGKSFGSSFLDSLHDETKDEDPDRDPHVLGESKPDTTDVDPDRDPHREENRSDISETKADSSEEKPQKKSLGSSFLDSLHDEINEDDKSSENAESDEGSDKGDETPDTDPHRE